MKTHLFTLAVVFVAGTAVAFVAANIILPSIEDFSIKTIDIDSSADLAEPDIEIFNYRAINPTVEVYIGDDETTPEPQPTPTPEENENGSAD